MTGRMGWVCEEAPSRGGEPKRLMDSTIDVVRGRFEDRTGGGLRPSGFSGYTIVRGAVDREACFDEEPGGRIHGDGRPPCGYLHMKGEV